MHNLVYIIIDLHTTPCRLNKPYHLSFFPAPSLPTMAEILRRVCLRRLSRSANFYEHENGIGQDISIDVDTNHTSYRKLLFIKS
jgi:hypothetical protein